jgi:hypothetical protein
MSDCSVKIVKSCFKLASKSVESLCGKISTIENENFLKNVDEDVLFVDDSIEIKEKFVEENQVKVSVNSKQFSKESFDDTQTDFKFSLTLPLSYQVQLPIQDIKSLLFDEIFMMSEPNVSMNNSNLIPNHNEIDETGSVCVMAETIDEDKILVYSTLQLFHGGMNVSQDVLSIVDENLKLVHEKIVERTFVGGKFVVRF